MQAAPKRGNDPFFPGSGDIVNFDLPCFISIWNSESDTFWRRVSSRSKMRAKNRIRIKSPSANQQVSQQCSESLDDAGNGRAYLLVRLAGQQRSLAEAGPGPDGTMRAASGRYAS
ncbi:hypothetical protein AVEN_55355-1 [Araneus ventricosus]|uniref:Uncharacterized protein n=1 Tax=Araneus ventricosus TaxID=182803 RepID=A0A4Y2DFP0_ARAVE|nr:hypothetical protein AVEN_55355-1 [Araneus ventricosus]